MSEPMSFCCPVSQSAVALHVHHLQKGRGLLQGLTPELYKQRLPEIFNSSLGAHFRHVVEHYLCFFQGLENGVVNYEGRARNPELETDLSTARQTLSALIDQLSGLALDVSSSLQVRAESSVGALMPSSILRELEFLQSHTVHHYALMAVMAGRLEIDLPEDFGVAPSTLKHWQTAGVSPIKQAA